MAYVLWLLVGGFSANGTSASQASWLAKHEPAMLALSRDQTALHADNPATGGNGDRWLADWQAFHDDVVAAASLPNPGGRATVPWREMLNDYDNGSAEIVQGASTRNQAELSRAQLDLQAGDDAARRFNHAMGIPTP
jgi:hypothetical protein